MFTEIYRGIWVMAFRELLHFVADRSRMISSFIFPLIFLVVFGAGFSRIIGGLAGDVEFIQFLYPGIVAMTVVMSSLFAGTSVVVDREYGFLKEVLVAPLSRIGIILGKALGGSFTAIRFVPRGSTPCDGTTWTAGWSVTSSSGSAGSS